MTAVRPSEHPDQGVPDHIARYIATKPVTLPQWIGMQDFWKGGDVQEYNAKPQVDTRRTTGTEDR